MQIPSVLNNIRTPKLRRRTYRFVRRSLKSLCVWAVVSILIMSNINTASAGIVTRSGNTTLMQEQTAAAQIQAVQGSEKIVKGVFGTSAKSAKVKFADIVKYDKLRSKKLKITPPQLAVPGELPTPKDKLEPAKSKVPARTNAALDGTTISRIGKSTGVESLHGDLLASNSPPNKSLPREHGPFVSEQTQTPRSRTTQTKSTQSTSVQSQATSPQTVVVQSQAYEPQGYQQQYSEPEASQPSQEESVVSDFVFPGRGGSPAPRQSFLALLDNNTVVPPDTSGAVGLEHIVTALNSEVRIQRRIDNANIGDPVALDSFWADLDFPDAFSPRTLYDPLTSTSDPTQRNNRFIFAAAADPVLQTSSVLVGASQTGNPSGTLNLFRIFADRDATQDANFDADPNNDVWADFPSVGFTRDWVIISVNMFATMNNQFVRSNIFVINKTDLYNTNTDPNFLLPYRLIRTDASSTFAPAVTYDDTLATAYLVQNWNGNEVDYYGNRRGRLRVSAIARDSAGVPQLTPGTAFPSTTNTWDFNPAPDSAGRILPDFAPQAGRPEKIQNNDARMQNVVYRNGSLWCAQTAFLPAGGAPSRSAVQWWELRGADVDPYWIATRQFGRVDDPGGYFFYAFPSITVNKYSDALIGYSSFSAGRFASASYSFRAGTDPLNTLRGSRVFKSGEASYFKLGGGTRNRWGNYSAATIDPLNDVDMWTLQEYAASPLSTPTTSVDRWGTWWARVAPPLRSLVSNGRTYGYNGPAVPIPGDGVNSAAIRFDVNNFNGNISDLNFRIGGSSCTNVAGATTVGIDHTYVGDLVMTLTSPQGTTVTLMNRPGSGVYGEWGSYGRNFCNTLLNDEGGGSSIQNITVEQAPYSGTYTPTSLLSAFRGQNPNGTWTLDVSDRYPYADTGNVRAFSLDIASDALSFTGPAVPIPDGTFGGIKIPFAVGGLIGSINDLNFRIDGSSCTNARGATTVGIDHTWVGDLVITLTSPQGTTVTFMNRPGIGNPNNNPVWGSSGVNFCNTLLDDEGGGIPIQNIDSYSAPYVGTYTPANALAAFRGQNPNGVWVLHVSDKYQYGDTGNVRAFSLNINAR